MFCNKSDHKKYGFVLVLHLFRDISSFKSKKGDHVQAYHVQASLINKKDTCTAKLQEIYS